MNNIEFEVESFSVAQLVQEYDELSKHNQLQEIQRKRTTVEVNIDLWAFLTAVSEVYGPTRTSFMNDLLKCASQEFFARLHPNVRRRVAELADKYELVDLKQAFKDAGGNIEHHGPGTWTALAALYDMKDAERQQQALQDQTQEVSQ